MQYKVVIIGGGRLAWSLIPALQAAGHEVLQLISRSNETLEDFSRTYDISTTQVIGELVVSDFVIITTGDSQVAEVVEDLHSYLSPQQMLLHTSGSVPMTVLAKATPSVGVLYPLQTFTKTAVVPLGKIPFFLENAQANDKQKLENLAKSLSEKVRFCDSQARMRIHLGAVFACNFTNYLYQIAESQLPPDTDFSVYEPLIRGQLDNVFRIGPQASQTGPAFRGDKETLQKHLKALSVHPHPKSADFLSLYKEISSLINPRLEGKDWER